MKKKVLLLLALIIFVLFRLPISILIIDVFSITGGLIDVPKEVLATNVVLSKGVLNVLIFGYTVYEINEAFASRLSDINKEMPAVMSSIAFVCYIIFDCYQAYNLIIL